jgi:hypothetical protein
MNRSDGALRYQRLRAPKHHGEKLIEPQLANASSLLRLNAKKSRARDYDCQGRSLAAMHGEARAELLAAAAAYTRNYRDVASAAQATDAPIVMCGHQPELYHPGVWIKNFVTASLALQQNAHAVHLLIDNDNIRHASIRVPADGLLQPRYESIAFDQPSDEMPFEERRVIDREQFASFDQRIQAALKPMFSDALIGQLWPHAVDAARRDANLGQCVAQARHRLEGTWGLQSWELPLSVICERPTFRRFAIHLLSELPRFQQIHNQSLFEYREVNRVRSQSHPVPSLATDGEWLEAPFWLWSKENTRRRRLFARTAPNGIELTDRRQFREVLPLSSGQVGPAVEKLGELADLGMRLRPRALITTMFARLFLCDLFIHGIGGAKYDQLTDVLIQRFFGFTAPSFLTVSATAKLPIHHETASQNELLRVHQTLRDLSFNPQRHAERTSETEPLIAAKQQLIAGAPSREARRQRHVEITRINAALQPFVSQKRQESLARRKSVRQQLRAEKVLGSREYAFCLFPAATLRPLLLDS